MSHLNDANAIFESGGLFHAMCQEGGGSWTHTVSADLAHWFTLPNALPSQPGWDTCDGTVSFPDLGQAPYNGSTPIIMYGPNCGGTLPPLPPPQVGLRGQARAGTSSGDYPRIAVSRPQRADDPYLRNWTEPHALVTFDGVACSFPGRVLARSSEVILT